MAQYFTIRNAAILRNCFNAIRKMGLNARVTIAPEQRRGSQNSMFHALCGDLEHSGLEWAGKARSLDQWKAILVSGHSVATGGEGEVIPGIEGEFVAIRESTSRMSVARASSLIEYTLAFCATNGIELTETRRGGFLPSPSIRAVEPRKAA
jgi:hypothetical protein